MVAAPFLSGGPVWDDSTLIAGRLVALDVGGMADLWAGPITPEGPGSTYYRPLALSLMALVGRVGMPALHLVALLAHAASAGLMVYLCRTTRAPLIAGLVFAAHPLASEVLGWASAIPDSLAVMLGLAGAAAGGGVGLCLLTLAGGLCKETALLVPVCFGLAGLLRPRWWRAWLLAVVVLMGLRFAVAVQAPPAVWHKVSFLPPAISWSLSGLVWPFPLSAVRDVRLAPAWATWVGALVVVGMAVGARRERVAWSGIGLVVLAPVLALPTVLDGYLVAERYMYPALVGAGLWVASVLSVQGRLRAFLGAVVVAGGVSSSWLRSPDWTSDLALFDAAVAAEPRSSLAWHLKGMAHLRASQPSKAADSLYLAIAQGHPYPTDHTLRLRALVEAGRSQEALAWAEEGPAEGLTATHMAWWVRAAWEAGDADRAAGLIRILRTPEGIDGPPWIRELAVTIEAARKRPVHEATQAP